MGITPCPACGKEVYEAAKSCPHCRHPLRRRDYRMILISLIAIVVFGGGGYLKWSLSGRGLPSCTSSNGDFRAEKAWDNGPYAKTHHVTILSMSDVKALSSIGDRIQCQATVLLNNMIEGTMAYSFSKNSSMPQGQYLIRAVLNTATMHPHS